MHSSIRENLFRYLRLEPPLQIHRITWYSLFHTSYHIKYKTFSNITKILIISTLGGKLIWIYTLQELIEEVPRVKRKECFNTDKSDVWNRLYHVMEKAITWHSFKTSQNGDMQWIWSGGWEWWAVSDVIGRWSWFYLHIYAAKYVYFWILQRRLARHWGASVIHAGSRWGYLNKKFPNRTMHGW
jgi:hypothetical protein